MKKLILILMMIMLSSFAYAAAVTRQVVTSQPIGLSSPFIVRYTVSGASGKWATSVEETLSGGCAPTLKKFVIASEAVDNSCASPCDITYTSRGTAGTCALDSASNYKFDTQSIVNFGTSLQVTVGATGQCVSGADNGASGSTANNDIIEWGEVNQAVIDWLGGLYDWNGINKAVSEWLNGC
jgi:hypothetical protein